MTHSHYLSCCLDPHLNKMAVDDVCYKLIELGLDFDTIVVTGLSGILVGVQVAFELGKQIAVVRKASEKSHGSRIEATGVIGRYIIVDDIIHTGRTVNKVMEQVKNKEYYSVCVAIIVYDDNDILNFCLDDVNNEILIYSALSEKREERIAHYLEYEVAF